jgi:HlyD family secretion protein
MTMEIVTAEGQPIAARAIGSSGPSGVSGVDDDPRREIRAGLIVAVLFFVIFIGWASFARLDAAAYAIGKVTVSGQRQTVQHRDGGVVGEIYVKDGERVSRGQVLLRLAAAEVRAQERSLSSQVIGLTAQRARLRAEQLGLSRIPVPPEFAALNGDDRGEAQRVMQIQTAQLRARSSLLSTQQSVLGSQRAQVGEQSIGLRSQVRAIEEQERLLNAELEGLRSVAAKGFVSANRIRALERALADLQGQRGRLQASIAESSESIGESRLRVVETERSQQERIASELRDVEFTLSELLPKLRAAKDQLARTEVRAPASGSIVGLSVFTEGGVIAPGQRLMDIVPEKSALLIEARLSPDNVDDLKIGQEATVRFSGLPDRDLPSLHGEVRRISADSFTDEKTGESFFTADVVVPASEIDKVRATRGAQFELKPGMPVQVLVPLRKRTAIQYLFEPLTASLWKAFREE